MFERVKWISRTSVRTSMTPRNHQGTYPEKFTNVRERSHTTAPCKSQQYYHWINVENTIDTRHRYRHYLVSSNPHTHEQTTFRSVNNHGTLLPWSKFVDSILHHTRSRATKSIVWKTDRRPPCDKNHQSKISSSSERISTLFNII